MVKMAAAEGVCIIIENKYIRGIIREYSCANTMFKISKIVTYVNYFR